MVSRHSHVGWLLGRWVFLLGLILDCFSFPRYLWGASLTDQDLQVTTESVSFNSSLPPTSVNSFPGAGWGIPLLLHFLFN